jgi:hypothetical protein
MFRRPSVGSFWQAENAEDSLLVLGPALRRTQPRGSIGAVLALNALLGGGVTGPAMAQPSIAVTGLPAERILLLPPSSPEVQGVARTGDVRDSLLPYLAAVRNDSGQDILAYEVHWTCTDASGKTTTASAGVASFLFRHWSGADPPPSVPADGTVLTLAGVGGADPSALMKSVAQDQAEGLLAYYSGQRTIVITLEAALLADGTAVGPDSGHAVPKWKAYLDAERDVFGLVAKLTPSQLNEGLRPWVDEGATRARAYGAADRPSAASLGGVAMMSASTYEDAYVLLRGSMAAETIQKAEQFGAETWVGRIRSYVGNRRYPNIHRKEN